MSKEEVVAQIEAAFADTPSPGTGYDDISATKCDDEGIVDYFRGTAWRGHRVQDLRHHVAALSFFTDQAFRYWLPAFMLAELEDPEAADIIAELIALQLTETEYSEARLQQFTQDELKAIIAFLDECARGYADGHHDMLFRKAGLAVRARLREA